MRSQSASGPGAVSSRARRRPATGHEDENDEFVQLMDAAVDFAVDSNCWPACRTLVTASPTELVSGMPFTAEEKLS